MFAIDTLHAPENIAGVSGNSQLNPQWHHRLSQVYRGNTGVHNTTPQTSNQQTAPNNQPAVQINIHQVPLGGRSQNVSRSGNEGAPSNSKGARNSPATPNNRQQKSDAGERSTSEKTNRKEAGKNKEIELSNKEKRQIRELEKREQEVKAHEQAHVAAAGAYATGGVNYEYKTGPDGERYIASGNVKLDTSPEDTPRETMRKMQQVRAAALAPANPSSSDIRVAQKAARLMRKAEEKLREQEQETQQGMNGEKAVKVDLSPESRNVNNDAQAVNTRDKENQEDIKKAAFGQNGNWGETNNNGDMNESDFGMRSEDKNAENAVSVWPSASEGPRHFRGESEGSEHSLTERKIGAYSKPFASHEASRGKHVQVQAV